MHLVIILAALLDFGTGPAQWLMTADEQKAWRAVKTDDEAKNFVDLFWARRDPTPGTFRNEFRDEFDSRVAFADRKFKEGNRRGALTERGRVLLVLGFPTNMSDDLARLNVTSAKADLGAAGGHETAARDVWKYEPKDAQKYGMPKIEVVFIHDGARGNVRRDSQRSDFTGALPAAIRLPIVSPDMKEVPDWARLRVIPTPSVVEGEGPGGSGGTMSAQTATPSPRSLAPARDDTVTKPAGAGRLTLMKDAWAMKPQSGKDPFAAMPDLHEFTRDDELGWGAEYCTGVIDEDPPNVRVKVTIAGVIKGERVTFRGEPEEFVPDSIRAFPGCYVVRGGIPLSEFDQGAYTLSITLGSYNLTKEFKVN